LVFFCEGHGITDPRLESEALELVGKCGGREILSRDRYVDVSRQPLNTTRDDGNAADDGRAALMPANDRCDIRKRTNDPRAQRLSRLAAHVRSFAH
jgi:hypothetical protein